MSHPLAIFFDEFLHPSDSKIVDPSSHQRIQIFKSLLYRSGCFSSCTILPVFYHTVSFSDLWPVLLPIRLSLSKNWIQERRFCLGVLLSFSLHSPSTEVSVLTSLWLTPLLGLLPVHFSQRYYSRLHTTHTSILLIQVPYQVYPDTRWIVSATAVLLVEPLLLSDFPIHSPSPLISETSELSVSRGFLSFCPTASLRRIKIWIVTIQSPGYFCGFFVFTPGFGGKAPAPNLNRAKHVPCGAGLLPPTFTSGAPRFIISGIILSLSWLACILGIHLSMIYN